ncbi:ferredoxin [Deltaproteobacteria bacterium TL4]
MTAPITNNDQNAFEPLVKFHLKGSSRAPQSTSNKMFAPAVLHALQNPRNFYQHYPLIFIPALNKETKMTVRPLSGYIEEMFSAQNDLSILSKNVLFFVQTLAQNLSAATTSVPLSQVLKTVIPAFLKGMDLSGAGQKDLQQECDRFAARVDVKALVLGLNQQTLLTLYTHLLGEERRSRQTRFAAEVKKLASELENLIRVDHNLSKEGASSQAISGALGNYSSAFLESGALAQSLPGKKGSLRLSSERKERIESSLALLETFLSQPEEKSYLVHSASLGVNAELPLQPLVEKADCLAKSLQTFEALIDERIKVFKAVRLARLEVSNQYEAHQHHDLFESFQWEDCSAEELNLLPDVLVVETASQIQKNFIHSFFQVLSSKYPVRLLILDPPQENLLQAKIDLGDLAMTQRDVLVIRSSLARPQHLVEGLIRTFSEKQSTVMVVSSPSWKDLSQDWLYMETALQSRATSVYRYDPMEGHTWASRFSLAGNPQVEAPWPLQTVSFMNAKAAEETVVIPFSYADFIALQPEFQHHFQVMEASLRIPELIPITEYLQLSESEQRNKLPFIWMLDENRQLRQALLTYDIARIAQTQHHKWLMIQEQGGIHNEYARQAAESAKLKVEAGANAALEALKTEHEKALLQAQKEAGKTTMERLARVLMNLEEGAVAAPRSQSTVSPVQPSSTPETARAPKEESKVQDVPVVEKDEALVAEAYIDSMLCTSCNDCFKINPQLFKYDSNNQAYIEDATMGTFADLVKAAAACPARCIHPGSPRSDDKTVTNELLEKAAQFN